MIETACIHKQNYHGMFALGTCNNYSASTQLSVAIGVTIPVLLVILFLGAVMLMYVGWRLKKRDKTTLEHPSAQPAVYALVEHPSAQSTVYAVIDFKKKSEVRQLETKAS